jgi:putative PIN family toxin of toxin-antitoxin system
LIIVYDSGVWISALHFHGTPRKALDSAVGRATIALCNPILDEIYKALQGKFRWRAEDVDQAIADFKKETKFFPITGRIRGICRDPNDDMVLECAVLAKADFIISGDKDLLSLGSYEGIRILTPREFLDLHVNEKLNSPAPS